METSRRSRTRQLVYEASAKLRGQAISPLINPLKIYPSLIQSSFISNLPNGLSQKTKQSRLTHGTHFQNGRHHVREVQEISREKRTQPIFFLPDPSYDGTRPQSMKSILWAALTLVTNGSHNDFAFPEVEGSGKRLTTIGGILVLLSYTTNS